MIMNISLIDLYEMSLGDRDCEGKIAFSVHHKNMNGNGEFTIGNSNPENPCINIELNRTDVLRLKKYCEDALSEATTNK